MNKYLLVLFVLLSVNSLGQPKQQSPVKPTGPILKTLLTGTGFPFKLINDSLYIIPFEGENIASYNVLIQKVSDLYIVYTNLTETLPGKIDNTKFKYLLQKNNDFDIIKIGLESSDNTVYVRADIFKSVTTTALMTRIIKQVANVTNIIAGDLK